MPSFRWTFFGLPWPASSRFASASVTSRSDRNCGPALGQAGAQLLHGAGVAVLVLDQQGFEIDLGLGHRDLSGGTRLWRTNSVFECGKADNSKLPTIRRRRPPG